MLLITLAAMTAPADDFSQQDRFFAQLTASMTSIVDGKSFRDALEDIAEQAQLNLWLDRRVDPTAPISAGPVGDTVFAALAKLAAERDCVVMPVANVILVGRPVWVDQTAATILSLKLKGGKTTVDISWENLTTPTEAMSQAVAGNANVEPALPHDLWPAIHWTQMDRRVAAALVLAQFDRRPPSTVSLREIKSVPATVEGQFTRRYSDGAASTAIRSAISEADPGSQMRVAGDWLVVTGSAPAHRAAATVMIEKLSVKAGPDPDKDTFTVKRISTSAANALQQLAQSAGKKCVIQSDAVQACGKIVSLEGEDVTLRTLIDTVAAQAGTIATWKGDTITISLKK